ncbi:MAG: UDP-N-acetylglucosamine--N-acetylmuramyl-(pentapeptide) pyrophosphoryl-undecaprenol N-acetylglucosamine transferase, partial [Litorimonas sp.]
AMALGRGVRQAKAFMRDWQPDVVVGFGGYPSFPALRAAESLNIPRVIHEQNAVLGRVNRVFARKAVAVASGFDDLARLPDGATHLPIGNPLRDTLISAARSAGEKKEEGAFRILAIGGSLGANILSERVPEALAALPEDMRANVTVVQQATESRIDAARDVFAKADIPATLDTFFSDIETHLASADLVIARAGASSVSEIALMGKPAIFIPLAIAMDDHQTANARTLERLGAARIIPESAFTAERLTQTIQEIMNDADWLDQAGANASKLARPDAARDLAALVVSAAGQQRD